MFILALGNQQAMLLVLINVKMTEMEFVKGLTIHVLQVTQV